MMPVRDCHDQAQDCDDHRGLSPECSDELRPQADDEVAGDETPERSRGGELLFEIPEVLQQFLAMPTQVRTRISLEQQPVDDERARSSMRSSALGLLRHEPYVAPR